MKQNVKLFFCACCGYLVFLRVWLSLIFGELPAAYFPVFSTFFRIFPLKFVDFPIFFRQKIFAPACDAAPKNRA
jgi:hypothetical protein